MSFLKRFERNNLNRDLRIIVAYAAIVIHFDKSVRMNSHINVCVIYFISILLQI